MTIAAADGRFEISRVVQMTIDSLKGNLKVFGLLALVLIAAPEAVIALVTQNMGKEGGAGNIVTTITQCILQGAVVHGVVASLNGQPLSFKACFDKGAQVFMPLWGIAILCALGIVLGLILLVVPGVILACAWSVAGPARVVEGPGVRRALGRSRALTKGHRGAIFVLILIAFVAFLGASFVIGLVAGDNLATNVIITPLLTAAVTVIYTVGCAVLYYELRRVKEGVGPEALAAMFD